MTPCPGPRSVPPDPLPSRRWPRKPTFARRMSSHCRRCRTTRRCRCCCPPPPGVRLASRDGELLDRLVEQAAARLIAELSPERAEPIVTRLRCLVLEAQSGRSAQGLALYASGGVSALRRLPIVVDSRVVVDTTFATRDLVRALHRTPRYYVLVLTDAVARLHEGVGASVRALAAGGFPMSRPARPPRGDRRGYGVEPSALRAAQQQTFLHAVDRGLASLLRVRPAPLVVVGPERLLAAFMASTAHRRVLAGSVRGSHGRTPPAQLGPLVRPVLQAHLGAREAEALARVEQASAAGRCASGIDDVWLLAGRSQGELLAVEEGFYYPARVSQDGERLTAATDVEHPEVVDDAVDEIIEIVLAGGGWVALVRDGGLRKRGRIALTLRT